MDSLIQLPKTAKFVGIVEKTDCQCCGKKNIAAAVISDGIQVIKIGCTCVSQRYAKTYSTPMTPAKVKQYAKCSRWARPDDNIYAIRLIDDTNRSEHQLLASCR